MCRPWFVQLAVWVLWLATAGDQLAAQEQPDGGPMAPLLLGDVGLATSAADLPATLAAPGNAPVVPMPVVTMPVGKWDESPIEPFRRQFYQGAELRAGYLADLGDRFGGVDETFEEVRVGFAVPLGSLDHILAVQPYFRLDHLRGPEGFDLPETLYDTGVNLFQREEWSETLSTVLLLTPSVRSDWTTSRNAFRLFGLGVVQWQASRQWRWTAGVVYLDRADLGVLPVIGLSWTPRPWWNIDLAMPRPRISRRLWKDGGRAEGWIYTGANLGGNTWAFTRAGGVPDEFTLSSLRAMIGYEKLVSGNRGLHVEAGVSFRRSVETELSGLDLDLDDGVYVEAGWKF